MESNKPHFFTHIDRQREITNGLMKRNVEVVRLSELTKMTIAEIHALPYAEFLVLCDTYKRKYQEDEYFRSQQKT